MKLYTGVVENRRDPLKLGRCQVRIVGLHTEQKVVLPTKDLPWAFPMQPVTSAAMNGIGHAPVGPVEGTWVIIFFRDADEQQPIMMGTIGGIPQADSKKIDEFTDFVELFPSAITSAGDKSKDVPQNVVLDGSGQPVTTGTGGFVTTGTADTPNQAATKSNQASDAAATTPDIPGSPPYGKREGSTVIIPQKSYAGIVALGKAMDAAGITGKYARASILGIAMGESECVPQVEAYNYPNPTYLKRVFSFLTDAEAERLASAPSKGITREQFFSVIYGPTKRGKNFLGNKTDEDGGKFLGRGYIQLTGRGNYEKYAKLSGIDIVNNPDLVNDITQGATVAIAYFKDRIPARVGQNDPGYMEVAMPAVGKDANGTSYDKKRKFYKYFLGAASANTVDTEKSAMPGETPANVTVNENGIPADRAQNLDTGFSDPDMKYPLRTHINEPDTNRLARSKTQGTAVQKKDDSRARGLKLADGGTFDQPEVPYNASYPYNHVFESESGHLQEFDDTPENERIHLYHKKGTFWEVDSNGTQVNRIVGDGYQIIDRNGYIYIKGASTITIEGATNVFINADANITVAGNTEMNLLNDAAINVAGDLDINVGGAFQVKCDTFTLETTGDSIDMTSATGVNIQGEEAINVKSAAEVNIQGEGDVNAKSAGAVNLQGGGDVSLKAGGNVAADGSIIDLANGSSSDAADAADAAKTSLGDPPDAATPENNTFETPEPPTRAMEESSSFETPEEHATPEGQAAAKSQENNAKNDTKPAEAAESSTPPANNVAPKGANCSAIMTMNEFPASFKITPNITFANCNDNGKMTHQLKAQGGLSIQEIVCNLKGVAENCMEPIFELAGGRKNIIISSGFRGEGFNGNKLSQHGKGQAMDFQLTGSGMNNPQLMYDFANKIAAAVPYDQMILEYTRGSRFTVWIHVSFNYAGNRKHAFTMVDNKVLGTYPGGFKLVTA
jgi:predicted chitinase